MKPTAGRVKARRVPLFLAFVTLLTLIAGCAPDGSDGNDGANGALSIVSTIFAPYDFTREITRGRADVAMLLKPGAESHAFEPTAADMVRIRNCDVFIYVGGESDAWVETILDSIDTDGIQIVTLMDCVDTVEEETVPGMEAPEEEEAAYDEHVWTSPRNAKRIVQKISDVLCGADRENAAVYQQNTAAYLEKLDALDAAFQAVVGRARRKTIVFGDRFPFRYFTDAYGLDYAAAFPGCAAETEASAATVAFLIDKVKAEKIPVVFHVELGNEDMARTIGEATGAKPMLLHAVHNISRDDFAAGVGYLDLMEQNVEALKEALW